MDDKKKRESANKEREKHALLLPRNLVMFFTTFSACHSLVMYVRSSFLLCLPFFLSDPSSLIIIHSMEYQSLVPLIMHVNPYYHNWLPVTFA